MSPAREAAVALILGYRYLISPILPEAAATSRRARPMRWRRCNVSARPKAGFLRCAGCCAATHGPGGVTTRCRSATPRLIFTGMIGLPGERTRPRTELRSLHMRIG
jgi:hypothetical protein